MFMLVSVILLHTIFELKDHNTDMTSHSVLWDWHTTLMYLHSSVVKGSPSIFVHSISVTMFSVYKELDQLCVTTPNDEIRTMNDKEIWKQ